jgi:hypothetical protein
MTVLYFHNSMFTHTHTHTHTHITRPLTFSISLDPMCYRLYITWTWIKLFTINYEMCQGIMNNPVYLCTVVFCTWSSNSRHWFWCRTLVIFTLWFTSCPWWPSLPETFRANINPSKTEINLNYIYRFSSYGAVNTLRFGYKYQSVSAV